jgi:hypothetical protein
MLTLKSWKPFIHKRYIIHAVTSTLHWFGTFDFWLWGMVNYVYSRKVRNMNELKDRIQMWYHLFLTKCASGLYILLLLTGCCVVNMMAIRLRLPCKHIAHLCKIKWFSPLGVNIRSRDSSVGIATTYGLDDRGVGVRVPVGSRIFSSPNCPDRLWGPHNLLSNGYRGLFPRG